MNSYPQYLERLEWKLNSIADACSSYARTYQESPPDKWAKEHAVLSAAWDGYHIIELKDARYKFAPPRRYDSYKEYLQEYVTVQFEQGFEKYLKTMLPKSLRWW
jgi:hypothetical protein